MEKIEFKDFPITDTPIDADNLNLLQNNVENGLEILDTGISNGWVSAGETWEYASVDDPTGVIYATGDVTQKYSVGMRIKFTNNSNTVYGIITALSSYDSGNDRTSVTFLHEINPSNSQALYLMQNSAINNTYYSNVKAPFGFPMNPDIWTLAFGVDTSTVINNPVSGTWYNINTYAIPVGLWKISYLLGMYPARSTTGTFGQKVTLSTTNNGETNTALSSFIYMAGAQEAILQSTLTDYMLNVTAQTNYYLNIKTDYTGLSFIRFWGVPLSRVYFICGYL